jgi:hypothetical protein
MLVIQATQEYSMKRKDRKRRRDIGSARVIETREQI